jgi:integrase
VLVREGRLLPVQQVKVPTFGEFAAGWWDFETCPYLRSRTKRRPISKSYAVRAKSTLVNHFLPFFGKMRLDKITQTDADNYLIALTDKGLTNDSANTTFKVFSLMMYYAFRQKIIKVNPCVQVEKLQKDEKTRVVLTPEEIASLFPADWREMWDDFTICTANKLAACTGMHIGEIMGLRGEYVHDTWLSVCGQYGNWGYIPNTKTYHNRNIPIAKMLLDDLGELKRLNGEGFLFSRDGGVTPVSRQVISRALKGALNQIGIDNAEIKRRGLTFHSWRHFFNTMLRMANVADSKVQAITGHTTIAMTEHYTHFDSAEFTEVKAVQESLLLPKKKTVV